MSLPAHIMNILDVSGEVSCAVIFVVTDTTLVYTPIQFTLKNWIMERKRKVAGFVIFLQLFIGYFRLDKC